MITQIKFLKKISWQNWSSGQQFRLQTQRAGDQIPQGAEVEMEEELRELELLMVVETVMEAKTLMEVQEDVA